MKLRVFFHGQLEYAVVSHPEPVSARQALEDNGANEGAPGNLMCSIGGFAYQRGELKACQIVYGSESASKR